MKKLIHGAIAGLLSGSFFVGSLVILSGERRIPPLSSQGEVVKLLGVTFLFFLLFSHLFGVLLRGFWVSYIASLGFSFLYNLFLLGLGLGEFPPGNLVGMIAWAIGNLAGVFYLYRVFEFPLPPWRPLRRAEDYRDLDKNPVPAP